MKILFSSNWSKMNTGFGKNAREILTRLYKAGHEIIEYAACNIKDGSPELNALPWKIRGVYPSDLSKISHLTSNENSMIAVAHGHFMIDQVLKEEKPDVCIFVEDIWHIHGFFHKPWWNKIPCIVWTPIDSLPIMPVFTEAQERLKYLWVKAEFAKRKLQDIGVQSKLFPCLIDQTKFYPLPAPERSLLRKQCGLEDVFVVGFVFRNQLRKLVTVLMEGYKIFLDKHKIKSKLLLHTNFSEPAGWNILGAAKELGIDRNDILTSYKCKNCRAAQIAPFAGNEINCSACGKEKGLLNVDINHGFTEQELNNVYNVMDCYVHPATSGGHEVPLEEAMLAGIPCATVDYTFGETYIRGGAYSLPFNTYRERESNFKKSSPTPEGIAEFLEQIYFNREGAEWQSDHQREWALDYFNPDKHAAGILEYIENLPKSTYDFEFTDLKNPDYPPDYSISNNSDFVIDLYKGIFDLEVPATHPEVAEYVKQLDFSSREDVVKRLKAIAQEHNARQQKLSVDDFLVKSDKKRIIYVEPGALSECVAWLYSVAGLIKKYPLEEWDHYVACKPEFAHVFAHLKHLKNVLPYSPAFDQPFMLEGRGDWKGHFDVALQPYMNPNWIHNGLD